MDKATLSKKSVIALERLAKKVGAKTVTPEGKKKNKTQLVNSIIMASRLGKKNPALKAKKAPAKKVTAKKTTAKKATAKKVVRKTAVKKATPRRRGLLGQRGKQAWIKDFASSAYHRYLNNKKKSFDTIFNDIVKGFADSNSFAYSFIGDLKFFDWTYAPRTPKNMSDLAKVALESMYTEIKAEFDLQVKYGK
jgi:hypothetical protein